MAEELKSGFSLKSLTWVALKDDESLDILEEKIEDINPAIVLVGTRGVGSQDQEHPATLHERRQADGHAVELQCSARGHADPGSGSDQLD